MSRVKHEVNDRMGGNFSGQVLGENLLYSTVYCQLKAEFPRERRYSRTGNLLCERSQLLEFTVTSILGLAPSVLAIVEQHRVSGDILASADRAMRFAVNFGDVDLPAHLGCKCLPDGRELLAVSTPWSEVLDKYVALLDSLCEVLWC